MGVRGYCCSSLLRASHAQLRQRMQAISSLCFLCDCSADQSMRQDRLEALTLYTSTACYCLLGPCATDSNLPTWNRIKHHEKSHKCYSILIYVLMHPSLAGQACQHQVNIHWQPCGPRMPKAVALQLAPAARPRCCGIPAPDQDQSKSQLRASGAAAARSRHVCAVWQAGLPGAQPDALSCVSLLFGGRCTRVTQLNAKPTR